MANSNSICASLLVVLCVTGCGGFGGGSTSPTVNADPGGIWTGTDSSTGQLTALITETGEMTVIRSDNAQLFGTLTVNGTSISGDIIGEAAFGGIFPDTSTHGTGTVTGTLNARSSIHATVKFTTDKGETTTSEVFLNYDSTYSESPNTATVANIAGNYTETFTGATVTIHSDGTVFAQDPNTGCVMNGTVQVINSAYDLYRADLDYEDCTTSFAPLDGVHFTGLVTFGAHNVAGLHDTNSKNFGLVYILTRF